MAETSLRAILNRTPWVSLEEHLNGLPDRIDASIAIAAEQRRQYRAELLDHNPDLPELIKRPSPSSMTQAQDLLTKGTVAAADGTLAPVALLGGSKIRVGLVIVSNTGEVVELVTRVFESELATQSSSAAGYFQEIREARSVSNLVARAIMLLGEREQLIDHPADWRLIHGELIPHELRTGAGNPSVNLPEAFAVAHRFIDSEQFIAVSESPEKDLDLLNASVILDPGEYLEIRPLTNDLRRFLDGDPSSGQAAANFTKADRARFDQFVEATGDKVQVILAKAGPRPFLLQCHADRADEAVALFMADSLWTRGQDTSGTDLAIRGFPYHIDLADHVAGNLLKASDFQELVEARLYGFDLESALFDIDPRRTRV